MDPGQVHVPCQRIMYWMMTCTKTGRKQKAFIARLLLSTPWFLPLGFAQFKL